MISLQERYKALIQSPSVLHFSEDFKLFKPTVASHADASPIHLHPEVLVFGKRMEQYLGHYLHTNPRYKVLAENLQISRKKITKGEIDFLVEDLQEKKTLHIEMACKFYVFRPDISYRDLDCWVGPNGKDSLAYKLNRLKQQQFPILYAPETKLKLDELGISAISIEQQLYMPGMLFMPLHDDFPLVMLNEKAVGGYWISKSDFIKSDYRDKQFCLPPKKDWLLAPQLGENWMDYDTAKDLILLSLQNQRAPLCWVKSTDGSFERFFVLQ